MGSQKTDMCMFDRNEHKQSVMTEEPNFIHSKSASVSMEIDGRLGRMQIHVGRGQGS